MDTFADAPQKHCLKKSVMHAKAVWGGTEKRGHSFTWSIEKFYSLKKNVEYWNTSDKLNWTFTIAKNNRFYHVTINTGDYGGEIECSVCYDKCVFSCPIIADRISGGLQKVNFPDDDVDVPENLYLRENRLVLVFKFNKVIGEIKPILQRKIIKSDLTSTFVESFLNVVDRFHLMDFIIYVQGAILVASKAILASRSSYFRQYIKDNCIDGELGKIYIDSTYDAMDTVLIFMYTGHATMDLKSEEYNEVLKLSKKFGMLKLQAILMEFMQDYVRKKK